jgi:hypothetical protein
MIFKLVTSKTDKMKVFSKRFFWNSTNAFVHALEFAKVVKEADITTHLWTSNNGYAVFPAQLYGNLWIPWNCRNLICLKKKYLNAIALEHNLEYIKNDTD